MKHQEVFGFTVKLARSIQELKELLKTDTPELVMAMVYKFQEKGIKRRISLSLNTSH